MRWRSTSVHRERAKESRATLETATIIHEEEGQTIRLPEAHRFAGERAYIERVGSAVVLLPYDAPYNVVLESPAAFTDDFMAERVQPTQPEREVPFA